VPVEDSNSLVLVGTTEGVALVDLDAGASSWQPHPSSGKLHGSSGGGSSTKDNSLNVKGARDQSAGPAGEVFVRMNDGKCDPQGRFWIGSIARHGSGPGGDLKDGGAALYRLDNWASHPTPVVPHVTVSNGLAWSLDNKTMLVIDSPTCRVDAFDYDSGTGALSNRRLAVRVSEQYPPVPDGCCLDSTGMLWVACFGSGEVRCYDLNLDAGSSDEEASSTTTTNYEEANSSPDEAMNQAKLLATIKLPPDAGDQCTAVAFGGADLGTLFVTTAHEFWDESQKAACPLAGALFAVGPEELLAKMGRVVTGLQASAFRL